MYSFTGGNKDHHSHLNKVAAKKVNVKLHSSQTFQKPNRQKYTYIFIQKIWNKSKQLQLVTDYTAYRPIWRNHIYAKLAKLQQVPRWRAWGITFLFQVLEYGRLMSFWTFNVNFHYRLICFTTTTVDPCSKGTSFSSPVAVPEVASLLE